MKDWIRCKFCNRWMHQSAKTCGNYCKWDKLVNKS